MLNIQVITGSTRPGRVNEQAAKWIHELASQREDLNVDYVDIADYKLPLLDEPMPPMMHQYSKDHTNEWAEKISKADGFIFVTPEYNRGTSAALKNAIDYLNLEWNNKAVGFVGYGTAGASHAVENLRIIASELHMADVRKNVMFTPENGFENYSVIKPNDGHVQAANEMLDQLTKWATALKSIR